MDSASIVHHSSTVPRSLPVLLPTEVIEEVIDQASDDLLALRCLSLLCKPLLTRARVHLFTSIVIRDVEQMESSREFLDSRPWLPPLVQKVTLFACMPYSYSKPNIPLLDIFRSHLFTQLPNLRAWGMRTEKHAISAQLSLHHSTISCYRIHSRRIQDLELESIKIQDVFHFVRLISAFTSIRKVTCYDIILRKQRQVSLLDSMILNRLSKPLKIQDLSINNTVDIRLVEYLLGSSIATLNNLSITLADPRYGSNSLNSTYFKRLEDSMSWLSKRCSLTVVLLFQTVSWAGEPWPLIGVRHIQWATRILDHVKSILRLGDVTVQIKSRTIAALGCSLSSATQAPVEACKALEMVLFAASASKVEFHWPKLDRRRAGRPEFWSPTIMSAFPRLNELGLLSLPSSRPSDPLGHEEYVTCLVASPDSKCIVTASLDGTIIVWDVKRGTVMQEWLTHHNTVAAVSFSPDSRRLVSAGGETLVVWDLSNLSINKVAVLESRQKVGTIVDCAWSPDNMTIASAFAVGSMSIWDALTF